MLGVEVHMVGGEGLFPESLHQGPLSLVGKHGEVAHAEVAAGTEEAQGVAHLEQRGAPA